MDDENQEIEPPERKDVPEFRLTFTAPSVCLELLTTRKVLKANSLNPRDHISKGLISQQSTDLDSTNNWQLLT